MDEEEDDEDEEEEEEEEPAPRKSKKSKRKSRGRMASVGTIRAKGELNISGKHDFEAMDLGEDSVTTFSMMLI